MAVLIIWLVSVLSLSLQAALVSATCSDDLLETFGGNNIVLEIGIPENTPAETLLLNVTSSDGLDLNFEGTDLEFIKVVDGAIFTALDIIVDGPENQEMCDNLGDDQTITVTCPQDGSLSPTEFLIVQFDYTDDYPTELNLTPVSVKEQVSGIVVVDLENPMVASDLDCDTSLTIQVEQDRSMEDFFDISGTVISLIKPLDYETRQQYTMDVSVLSQLGSSREQLRVDGVLEIIVEDVDDRDPIFSQQVYTLEMLENLGREDRRDWFNSTPPIEAVDGDTAINEIIEYSILSVEPHLDLDISKTGQIRINSQLDREEIELYSIIIKAQQANYPTASATATLLLMVTDRNDNRPGFSEDQVVEVTLSEGAAVGSTVVWLQASDIDEGANSEFDYIIVDDTGVFEVKTNDYTQFGQLVVKDPSSLFSSVNFSLQIDLLELEPGDGGDACDFVTTCTVDIFVLVSDINDNSPVFSRNLYHMIIYNNTVIGADDGKVEATDADVGSNSVLTYSLLVISDDLDLGCSNVDIEAASGRITLLEEMESPVTCYYTVQACDSAVADSRCSVVPFIIKVIPVSSESDVALLKSVSIEENQPEGTLVTQLPIDDLYTDDTNFVIVDNLLKTAAVLDYETQTRHDLSLWLTPDTNSTEVARITVMVTDVNDNSPAFDISDYQIVLTPYTDLGDVVLRVQAYDPDVADTLSFSLLNMRDSFGIDSQSGEIMLTEHAIVVAYMVASLDDEPLVAQVNDSIWSDTVQIKIIVIASNETALVYVPVVKEALENNTTLVESTLSDILSLTIHVDSVKTIGPVPDLGSEIVIRAEAKDSSSMSAVELQSLVTQNAQKIYDTFFIEFQGWSTCADLGLVSKQPTTTITTTTTVTAEGAASATTETETTTDNTGACALTSCEDV